MVEILKAIILLSVVVGLGYIAITDFRKYEIPDKVSIIILAFLLLVNIGAFLFYGPDFSYTVLSAIFSPFASLQVALILGTLSLAIVVFSKEKAMGQGDIRMLIIAGLLVGTSRFILFYASTLSLAICYGLYLGMRAKKLAGVKVPLGTFIVVGVYISLLFSLFP